MTKQERYQGIITYFKTNVPVAQTELQYSNPFELLVAVILSAQCTDKRINQVTPTLFKAFPTPEALAASNPDTIFTYIRSVSYPRNKAKHLVGMANMLLNDFHGIIPSELHDLVKLPGVGRKTANVVASVIYEKPAMAVDTHVFRVSNRMGLTKAKTPLQCELQLVKHIPKQYVATAHHWLILHGRYICIARNPKCGSCPLSRWCHYFETNSVSSGTKQKLKKYSPINVSIKAQSPTFKKQLNASTQQKTVINKSIQSIDVMPKKISEKTKEVVVKKATATKKAISTKFIAHSTHLKNGDKAPAFKAMDQYGKLISLSDFKGKTVVLYFYPKDNTPGCTLEACSLRDEHAVLTKKNHVVLGVSADDVKMHKKFSDKFELPFSLLADTDKSIIKAYDVWGKKQFMGKVFDGIIRTTFIINEKGVITNVIKEVNTKEHGKQVLDLS